MPALTPRPQGSLPEPIVHTPPSWVSTRAHCSHPTLRGLLPRLFFTPHPRGSLPEPIFHTPAWDSNPDPSVYPSQKKDEKNGHLCISLAGLSVSYRRTLYIHMRYHQYYILRIYRPGNDHALDNKSKSDTFGLLFVGLLTLLMQRI
jgi:hypothetical protein